MKKLLGLALSLLGVGCATPSTGTIRLEASDHYCAQTDDERVCVSGVRRGLDQALKQSLLESEDLVGRLELVDLSFRGDDTRGSVELTYALELRHRGDGVVAARTETLREDYFGEPSGARRGAPSEAVPSEVARSSQLRREALLKLLVGVVVRVRGELARASGGPVSL